MIPDWSGQLRPSSLCMVLGEAARDLRSWLPAILGVSSTPIALALIWAMNQ